MRRVSIDPSLVDDVIFGCVDQFGAQSMNIARNAWLSAGFDQSVPGVTIERQCGSSQQAISFASQVIRSGDADCIVAGGVEVMSTVPIMSALFQGEKAGTGHAWKGEGWRRRFGSEEITQFRGAELIAERWGLERRRLEDFAVSSHQRAFAAWEAGRFDREVEPVEGVVRDEGIRPDTSVKVLEGLKPIRPDGRLTAGTSSQISDAAAAVLVASDSFVRRHHLDAMVKVHTCVVVGSDPIEMLSGPIPATQKLLSRSGVQLDEVGLFECNEAFASVVLAWQDSLGIDADRVNVNGGAISLGHPLGATGARIATSLVHEMVRSSTRYGVQTMCEGAGMANATLYELVAF
jgi:acetyl-CoA C-acetyltransferase